MYTSYIGNKFLQYYNQQNGTHLTARSLFDEVFFPLFFDHETHLMHVSNSPFFQKPSQKALESGISIPQLQLQKLHNDIKTDTPNMAICVGSAAKDIEGTTSGQVSSIVLNTTADEMYASWIGQGLAIGVSGGLVFLIDNEDAFAALYSGWTFYRTFLTQTPNVKDKQIETWNGQWLSHVFGHNYNKEDPWANFKIETVEALGNIAIPTQPWSKVVFALARQMPGKIITAYVYSLSQTNTTLGFINFQLPEVTKMFEFRDRIFLNKKETLLDDNEIANLLPFFNFKAACKLGIIGLKALEPDKLRDYMPKGSVIYSRGNDYKFTDDRSYLHFNLYKTWIIAMLNKTELLELASEMARAMHGIEIGRKPDNRGKTTLSQDSKEVLEAKNLRDFIKAVTELLDQSPNNAAVFKATIDQVVPMPSDNFPLFITLVRFEYTYQKHTIDINTLKR
jgi:hypothetical protein